MQIPDSFRDTITAVFSDEGKAWLDSLGSLIRQYEQRWSIQVGEPFVLSYSYCAPALRADGSQVVLKLEVPNHESRHRAQALLHYNGRGIVRLLEADIERGASLMERLKPGQTLAEAVSDDEQATRITATVMQELWIPAPGDYPFPSVVDWMRNFQRIHDMQAAGTCPLPAKTIERTEAFFTELQDTSTERVLLHGDLHHFNILCVGEELQEWRAIDPFGVIGEREVEVGAMMRNPNLKLPVDEKLRKILFRRFKIFQEMLGFDWQCMVAWASIYAIVSAWWSISDRIENWHLDAALGDEFASWVKTPPNFS